MGENPHEKSEMWKKVVWWWNEQFRNVHHRSKWKWRPKKRRSEEKNSIFVFSNRFEWISMHESVQGRTAGSSPLLLVTPSTSVRDRAKRIFLRGSALFRLSFSFSLTPHFFCFEVVEHKLWFFSFSCCRRVRNWMRSPSTRGWRLYWPP